MYKAKRCGHCCRINSVCCEPGTIRNQYFAEIVASVIAPIEAQYNEIKAYDKFSDRCVVPDVLCFKMDQVVMKLSTKT